MALLVALLAVAGLASRGPVSREVVSGVPAPSAAVERPAAHAPGAPTEPSPEVRPRPEPQAVEEEGSAPQEAEPTEYACLAAARRARALEQLLDRIEADPVAAAPVLADAVRDGAEGFLADTHPGATGRYADGCLEADDPVRAAIERLRAVADESTALDDLVADLEAIEADAAP